MSTKGSRSCAWAVLVVFTAAGAGAAPAPRPLTRGNAEPVERAREGAARRLHAEECRKVLTDFADARGHSLRENLEARGLSATDYLETIAFVNGSRTRSCRRGPRVLLVATPGMGSVGVCPMGGDPFTTRFAQVQLRNPSLAEFLVIHEMLHTLGLGEDPPTGEEITGQVRLRCGS